MEQREMNKKPYAIIRVPTKIETCRECPESNFGTPGYKCLALKREVNVRAWEEIDPECPYLQDATDEVCRWESFDSGDVQIECTSYILPNAEKIGEESGVYVPPFSYCPYCGKKIEVENGLGLRGGENG